MSRRVLSLAPTLIVFVPSAGMAQDTDSEGLTPDERDCRRRQEAALISGEIVVCGDRAQNDRHRLAPPGEARKRFAEETMDRGLGLAPDFAPPPCVPNLLTWCSGTGPVSDQPVIVDFDDLPEAPEGSDADRIAKGEIPQ